MSKLTKINYYKRILKLHQKLNVVPPDVQDKCAWSLLYRALEETHHAVPAVFEAKAQALIILIKYGWRDVFKENLNEDGKFKSAEESARFQNCLQ